PFVVKGLRRRWRARVLSGLVLSGLVLRSLVLSGLVLSSLVLRSLRALRVLRTLRILSAGGRREEHPTRHEGAEEMRPEPRCPGAAHQSSFFPKGRTFVLDGAVLAAPVGAPAVDVFVEGAVFTIAGALVAGALACGASVETGALAAVA